MSLTTTYFPEIGAVRRASEVLADVALKTPLAYNKRLSEKYEAEIFFKREDLQQVRSYKIRGAYNKMHSLSESERKLGIVCASAGNHAQGVAFACGHLGIQGRIFMPSPTPRQKVEQVRMFGGTSVDVVLIGDTFDDAHEAARQESKRTNREFIHPFDDEKIIEGQGTVGLEILEQSDTAPDYLFVPVGGGGLIAGVSSVCSQVSPETNVIGVEPIGAAAMHNALNHNSNISLQSIDKFVDGAAVKKAGDLNFDICRQLGTKVITVEEGKICQTILEMYNKDAIVVEPAGALSISVLDRFSEEIRGKRVVCVISGSNNDITRTAEIEEKALLHNGLKHYFIVRFPQRAGALKEFVAEILGPGDDITYFEYSKKTNREKGPAVVGIQLTSPEDLNPLIDRMRERHFFGDYLNDKPDLFQFLV